ncbi:hypothetical protein FE257_010457 [Aspergillus nanangensis]|uniref:Uncharacterized protein n=1 Tax=Aspergillus nanangensis TaxID=2582783 RepID=A0AAD4GT97_ASPNN|nr:hypothetical protein FE257_010457 [Aspergillus nanangensis]
MYSKVAVVLSLLAASVSGAAIEARTPQVTVALSNDQTGAYSGVAFAADGVFHPISALWAGTPIAKGGLKASSAQLNAFPQTITCAIRNNNAIIGTLSAWKTYVDLDGNPSVSTPVDLSKAQINCSA